MHAFPSLPRPLIGGVRTLLLSLLFLAGASQLSAQIGVGFTGTFAPANWQFTSGGTPSSVTWSGESSFILRGSDDNSNSASTTTLLVSLLSEYRVSFDWLYTSADSGEWDWAGYRNGMAPDVILANNDTQGSGSVTKTLFGPGSAGFFVHSVDNVFGEGVLTISNFSALAVPEPSTAALLMGLLALGIGIIRSQRLRREKRIG